MKIYLAGPLFTAAEQAFNEQLAKILIELGHTVFLPQEECANAENSTEIFAKCSTGVEQCEIIVAILDGADADSGTCWEVGYGYALKRKIFGVRTDFRQSGDSGGFNAMLLNSLNRICSGPDWEVQLLDSLK